MNVISTIFNLLPKAERVEGLKLGLWVLLMAFLDTLGVASIMPFIGILVASGERQEGIQIEPIVNALNQIGITTQTEILVALGLAAFALLLLSLMCKAYTNYKLINFSLGCEHIIGRRLLKLYLYQNYLWLSQKSGVDISKKILSEVNQVIYYALIPSITVMAQSVVVLFLFTFLLFIDFRVTIWVCVILGLSYVGIYLMARKHIAALGVERLEANEMRYSIVNEAFSVIKLIKLTLQEKSFIKDFSYFSETYVRSQSYAQVIAQVPRYALEAIAFGGLLLIILFLMSADYSIERILPMLSLFAFAGYRLMPALQQIYASATQLKYAKSAVTILSEDIKLLSPSVQNYDDLPFVDAQMNFEQRIDLHNVKFKYQKNNRVALRDVNLTIKKGLSVGVVGVTGSGKTTLIDIMSGLIEPSEGYMSVDGVPITSDNKNSFLSMVGYVTQDTELMSATIAENIAFARINNANLKMDQVIEAAKVAQIHDFIINHLPDGYNTMIGSGGINLSGGEQQRVGIARAIYRRPKILFLDEASSALDAKTEKNVLEAIHTKYDKDITIISIAHRLNTLDNCEEIIEVQNGKVKKVKNKAASALK